MTMTSSLEICTSWASASFSPHKFGKGQKTLQTSRFQQSSTFNPSHSRSFPLLAHLARTHRPFTLSLIIEHQTNNEKANHFSVLLAYCGCLHSHECKDDMEGRERIAGFPFSLIPKIDFAFRVVISNVLPLVRLAGHQRSRSLIPSSSFGRYGSRIDGTGR